MGFWHFLGGNINHERVAKNIQKEIKYQNELFAIRFKSWKKSDMSIEEKLDFAMKQWGEEDTKIFFNRYPNLIPDELNPFIKKPELSEVEELKLKVQKLEKNLQKIKNN